MTIIRCSRVSWCGETDKYQGNGDSFRYSAQGRPPEHHRNQHYPWQQVMKQQWSQGSSEALQTQHTQRDAASLINAILWSQEPGKPHVIHKSCTCHQVRSRVTTVATTRLSSVHALPLPFFAKQLCQSCLPDVQELLIRQHQTRPVSLSTCVDAIQPKAHDAVQVLNAWDWPFMAPGPLLSCP